MITYCCNFLHTMFLQMNYANKFLLWNKQIIVIKQFFCEFKICLAYSTIPNIWQPFCFFKQSYKIHAVKCLCDHGYNSEVFLFMINWVVSKDINDKKRLKEIFCWLPVTAGFQKCGSICIFFALLLCSYFWFAAMKQFFESLSFVQGVDPLKNVISLITLLLFLLLQTVYLTNIAYILNALHCGLFVKLNLCCSCKLSLLCMQSGTTESNPNRDTNDALDMWAHKT